MSKRESRADARPSREPTWNSSPCAHAACSSRGPVDAETPAQADLSPRVPSQCEPRPSRCGECRSDVELSTPEFRAGCGTHAPMYNVSGNSPTVSGGLPPHSSPLPQYCRSSTLSCCPAKDSSRCGSPNPESMWNPCVMHRCGSPSPDADAEFPSPGPMLNASPDPDVEFPSPDPMLRARVLSRC